MHTRSELRELLNATLPSRSRFEVPLSELSRWRIGGLAAAIVEPESAEETAQVLQRLSSSDIPLLVVGDMSNLLFDSAGFRGVILRISSTMAGVEICGTRVRSRAGVSVPTLARTTADAGLSGLEHAVGIPGTLGGLVAMNGGSQRKGIGLNVDRVICLDRSGGRISLSQEECEFGYRSSVIQRMDAVIVEVDLHLEKASPSQVHASMDEVMETRRSRFPEQLPNCGSTFLSDPGMYDTVGPPGRAIESVGLKGYVHGGAQISPQHANFVVNRGGATSDDVLNVIQHARQRVFDETGFMMDCEVRYVSPTGDVMPAHKAVPSLQRS
jgi:UDP-N-acetylmuramate dehydrogenase